MRNNPFAYNLVAIDSFKEKEQNIPLYLKFDINTSKTYVTGYVTRISKDSIWIGGTPIPLDAIEVCVARRNGFSRTMANLLYVPAVITGLTAVGFVIRGIDCQRNPDPFRFCNGPAFDFGWGAFFAGFTTGTILLSQHLRRKKYVREKAYGFKAVAR